MGERIHFWFGCVGSAALVAFLATCLEAPRVTTYSCDTPSDQPEERCELVETVAAAPGGTAAPRPDATAESRRLAVTLNALN
jgi:hypothetical protein